MDKVPSNDVLQVSINLYRMMGESGRKNPKFLYLFRIFNSVTLTIAIVFTAASFAHVQGELYMKSLEGTLTASHTLIKYIWFIYYKQDIQNLISKSESFWNHNRCDAKLSDSIQKMHRYIEIMQKFTALLTFNNVLMISLRPALDNSIRFIFDAWVPSGNIFWETLALFSQFHLVVMMVPAILGCDFLYMSLTLHMVSQMRMLNYELEHMDRKCDVELIRECVRQHRLMLYMFDQIKNIFFWLLILHYFVTLITGCTQMYLIMVGNTKSMDLFITSVHVFMVVFEFSFYTIPIEAVVAELKYISTAVYMSSWYKRDINEKKLLLFVMMRSQQQKYLSVGGIVNMNVDAFGSTAMRLKLLTEKNRLQEGDVSKAVLREIVKHYQLILSVLRRMNKEYSLVFLLQFVVTIIASSCSEMLFLSLGNTDKWIRLMKSFIYCSYLLFVKYFIPSDEICFKMLQFSQAIYFSNWNETLKINIKDIAFLLVDIHKDVHFTIEATMDLNMEVYVMVMRATFTFYDFVHNMLLKWT